MSKVQNPAYKIVVLIISFTLEAATCLEVLVAISFSNVHA